MMLHLRTNGDPAALAEAARRALREVAPGFPMYEVATLEARIGSALAQPRFLAQLLSLFALLAIVLATIGTYGVIAHSVAQGNLVCQDGCRREHTKEGNCGDGREMGTRHGSYSSQARW